MNALAIALFLALIVVLCIPAQRAPIWRGLIAMQHVFGLQFTCAVLGVGALAIGAIWHQHGDLASVAAMVMLLLAIRAHDIGAEELERPEPTEYESYWHGLQWTEAEKAHMRNITEAAQANIAQAETRFNRIHFEPEGPGAKLVDDIRRSDEYRFQRARNTCALGHMPQPFGDLGTL